MARRSNHSPLWETNGAEVANDRNQLGRGARPEAFSERLGDDWSKRNRMSFSDGGHLRKGGSDHAVADTDHEGYRLRIWFRGDGTRLLVIFLGGLPSRRTILLSVIARPWPCLSFGIV
jgi:hypothetical protein